MSKKGILVLSLDFELYWGMFDKVTLEEYGKNIRGAHTVIPELLDIFAEYQVHATWATVGMLMCEDKGELYAALPQKDLRPVYEDMSVSSYEHLEHGTVGENVHEDPYHYGDDLIPKIVEAEHQELASHTFSHYYCIDGSKNGEAIFAADCRAFKSVSGRFGRKITSIVFPRNQTTPAALKVCGDFGLTAYRGTPSHFLYTGKKEGDQTNLLLRMLRLIDAYVNISGHHTYPLSKVSEGFLANVAGSRFFRPYSAALGLFEQLRIARIKQSMTHAARDNEIFHLWWHPHNFGVSQKENMKNLREVLEHFKLLQRTYGMESLAMSEVAIRANGSSV